MEKDKPHVNSLGDFVLDSGMLVGYGHNQDQGLVDELAIDMIAKTKDAYIKACGGVFVTQLDILSDKQAELYQAYMDAVRTAKKGT